MAQERRRSSAADADCSHLRYRINYLETNHIYIHDAVDVLPLPIEDHANTHIWIDVGESPQDPDPDYLLAFDRFKKLESDCNEDDVELALRGGVFPHRNDQAYGHRVGLATAGGTTVYPHLVPDDDESPFKITPPKCDLMYGYTATIGNPFTQRQFVAQMPEYPDHQDHPVFAAATPDGDLRFPFLVVQFKVMPVGARGPRDDLWVAANECAVLAASCLTAIKALNHSHCKYRRTEVKDVEEIVYAITVDNHIARLYVAWINDNNPWPDSMDLARIGEFVLNRPEDFKYFRMAVHNILEWGKGDRLDHIKAMLDAIAEVMQN
ncbi:hypothetical protein B0J18DRAFT_425328 [Chaetomium sp. MPI-SDFR-AT-0129]|nr:hypothetical protein B0J18DRAFT_425328 [Chaetomium sp. MPI-SDFR-AT-0129]